MKFVLLVVPVIRLSEELIKTTWYVILSEFLSSHGISPHEMVMLVEEVEEMARSCGGDEGATVCTCNNMLSISIES